MLRIILTLSLLLLGFAPARASIRIVTVPCGTPLPTAASHPLAPGDSLLFERGCVWTVSTPQRLTMSWQGTAAQPITIGAYGAGLPPAQRKRAPRWMSTPSPTRGRPRCPPTAITNSRSMTCRGPALRLSLRRI